MPPVIKVNNLSKSFIISHQGREKYTALRDVWSGKIKSIFSQKKSHIYNKEKEEFWALKNVSFQVEQGDRLAIIGRNGAGKSTLLKILSRITEPSSGRIIMNGRVASLLEVGTGFHPELTGRENIFLNGAIMGMSRREILNKFDEIVAFAEVEKFLDTPVKRYSSGMYVRLAFAVAAHLEPEILVVDEVLAVGDAQFQEKCLGKMEEVSKQHGRTVLFVSHNMSAVANLCTKGILLSEGQIASSGEIGSVMNEYLVKNKLSATKTKQDIAGLKWWINNIYIKQKDVETRYLSSQHPITIHLDFEGKENRKISFEILIKDSSYNPVWYVPLGIGQNINLNCTPGKFSLTLDLQLPQLALGEYHIDVFIVESFIERISTFYNAFSFEIVSSFVEATGWNFEKFSSLGSMMGKINEYTLTEIKGS